MVCVLLCFFLLPQQAVATDLTLDETITTLQTEYGLTEENFSLCYYNTVTAETYMFAPDHWMIAGSTYKLPLNMYYYEQEAAGAIAPDTNIGGHTLAEIHYESIVNSNNELSETLIHHFTSFRAYKEAMFAHYGGLTTEGLDEIVWSKNYFTTRYMCNTLRYLYENSAHFTQLLDYLQQAQPNAYFKKYVTQYQIAHKYGSYGGAENDVGIVYTAEPYLLAVYTYGLSDGEEVVARVNEAICKYNVTKTAIEAEETAAEAEAAQAATVTTPTVEPETTPTVSLQSSTIMLCLSGAILLAVGCWIELLVRRRRKCCKNEKTDT